METPDPEGTVQASTDQRERISIPLLEPISRGETKVTKVVLRKPKAGELRGLTLQSLVTTEVTALLTLIPRISEPPLTAEEVNQIDPGDFSELGGAIRGFFMTAAEKQLMEAVQESHQPTS